MQQGCKVTKNNKITKSNKSKKATTTTTTKARKQQQQQQQQQESNNNNNNNKETTTKARKQQQKQESNNNNNNNKKTTKTRKKQQQESNKNSKKATTAMNRLIGEVDSDGRVAYLLGQGQHQTRLAHARRAFQQDWSLQLQRPQHSHAIGHGGWSLERKLTADWFVGTFAQRKWTNRKVIAVDVGT